MHIIVTQRVATRDLSDHEDRQSKPAGSGGKGAKKLYEPPEGYDTTREVLDWFHLNVPIGCLDDFDIRIGIDPGEMPTVTIDVEKVDWRLLREQKHELVKLLQDSAAGLSVQQREALDGLLHLIDHVQDQAAVELSDDFVFGRTYATRQ